MTVMEDLRKALREVLGADARAHGYRGTSPTWRRSTPAGDWAVVNVQSSQSSNARAVRCVINLAVAPEPWLRWWQEKLGPGMPKAVRESLGLYRQRLHPTLAPEGIEQWWLVDSPRRVPTAVEDMQAQLDRKGWPVLERLLDRTALMEHLRHGELGPYERRPAPSWLASAEALLLMDEGPSAALDEQLAIAQADLTPPQREDGERFEAWVRRQAAAAD